MEIDFSFINMDNRLYRTIFVSGYPRFVTAGWLDPIINFDHTLNLSFFIYPVEGKTVLDDLRRKIAEMEAEISTDVQRGRIINPGTQAKLEDAIGLQEQLVRGAERFFQFGFYITIPADNREELENVTKQIQSTLGALLINAKPATLSQEDGFISSLPLGYDELTITRNMDTSSLSTTFPFTSAELSQEEGVMYGINEDNGSLIIFDRFKLENPNTTIFGTSGSGKSYFVKLEAVRYLMVGTEIIIIDPEAEYQTLCEAVGGQLISFSFGSPSKINPFDLQTVQAPGENQLALKLLSLHSLFKVIMGALTPQEEALLDRAMISTYRAKGITQDPQTHNREAPLMEDLYKTFIGMEEPEAANLAARLEKFVKGSFTGIFDQHTTVDITNPFTVFSVRDLEDALRPIAMFIILDFIWTRVRRDIKRRILIVDEAWHMMRYPDSAMFLWSVAKRARKYWLGLSTITQDVEDFLAQEIGKAIVNNAAMRILMKQSASAIDRVGEVFHLSEGEKQLLLSADIGEGIFFAGPHHVAMRSVASEKEHALITTKPEELAARQSFGSIQNPQPAPNPEPPTATIPATVTWNLTPNPKPST
ncbi:ATP-binding protein [Candidatus Microgenomates bacterium]|nr:ATP-binding protein [Candidatus Microgenomates bacterium]